MEIGSSWDAPGAEGEVVSRVQWQGARAGSRRALQPHLACRSGPVLREKCPTLCHIPPKPTGMAELVPGASG